MGGFQPLRTRGVLRAALILLLATAWSVVFRGHPARRARRRRLVGTAAMLYVILFAAAALVGGSVAPVIGALAVLAAAAGGFYLVAVGLLLRVVLHPTGRAWTDEQVSLLVTGRVVDVCTLELSNLAAWPIGRTRSSAFLQALCTMADREGWTITGRAGHRYLYERLYVPLGFTSREEGARRPRIVRDPRAPGR